GKWWRAGCPVEDRQPAHPLERTPEDRSFPDRSAAPSGSEPAVRTARLGKVYRHPWTGRLVSGVEDLNFEVARGEVMGCLGPNGAGKTTTLQLLNRLLKPTARNA